jgi:hypothetical protein
LSTELLFIASAALTSGSASAFGTTGIPNVISGSPISGKSAYGSIGTAGTTGGTLGIATPSTSALTLLAFFLSSSTIDFQNIICSCSLCWS